MRIEGEVWSIRAVAAYLSVLGDAAFGDATPTNPNAGSRI
jgi:hypothetical protein